MFLRDKYTAGMKTRTSISQEPDGKSGRKPDKITCSPDGLSSSNTVAIDQTKEKRSSSQQRLRRKYNKEKFSRPEQPENAIEHFTESTRSTVCLESKANCPNRQDNSDWSNSPKSPKKNGGKKGRNLDVVVRRMLKAKKESEEEQCRISCEADAIKSNDAYINTDAGSGATEHIKVRGERESVRPNSRDTKFSACVTNEGMIDVQLSSDSRHLLKPEEEISPRSVLRIRPANLSGNLIDESYSSLDFSPNPFSHNERSGLKPFVQSPSARSTSSDQHQEETKAMSPIIKDEPVTTENSRVALYHQNGPAQVHSPSSSCNSHSSPDCRTPSPNSPVERNALPSPPELIMNHGMPQLSPHSAGMLMMNSHIPPLMSDSLGYPRRSPNNRSPHSNIADLQFSRDPGTSRVTAAAMAASGIGLPTLVPTVSAIPSSNAQRIFCIETGGGRYNDMSDQRQTNASGGTKVSPNAPTGPNPPRGIVGQKEAAIANEPRGGRRSGSNVDEKCSYKRPPHTYPALIASAILDSPGNLITLRSIYDYIMNNFPYYKFGHDKSAWQNSIRHNLSLNQCFVKVPRYENAAKSNYWTMTREGFEEFGNENSFKRRRRRGAALAPISAYKNKKSNNNEGLKTNKLRGAPGANSSIRDGAKAVNFSMPGWPARSRTPEPGVNYKGCVRDITQSSKRTASPGSDITAGKHPRMMILKQGEGPAIEGLSGSTDHPQRPNSLSSVEEMQGNLNSFSKSLNAAAGNNFTDAVSWRSNGNSHAEVLKQQWMMAAMQKNLNLFQPGILPNLTPSPPPLLVALDGQVKTLAEQSGGNVRIPVVLDGLEIGFQVPLHLGNVGSHPAQSYCCRFCDYNQIDDSSATLENHCQLMHHLEITNARAKDVAAAAVASRRKDFDPRTKSQNGRHENQGTSSPMSLLDMVPSLSPSMLAAAASYNNAQNFLAAAQAAGLGLPISPAYPNSLTIPSVVSSGPSQLDSLTRALAQHIGSGSSQHKTAAGSINRQHLAGMINATEPTNLSQEQLRQFIYQQLITQNPFFPGNPSITSTIPRPGPGAHNEMSQLAHLWQYQQKVFEIAAQSVKEKTEQKPATVTKEPISNLLQARSPIRNRRESSSSNSSRQNERAYDGDVERTHDDIHGWKQCRDCDFTAKGAHGLELHSRKVHAGDLAKEELDNKLQNSKDASEETLINRGGAYKQDSIGDCSEGSEFSTRSSAQSKSSDSGTQTKNEEEKRTCEYCDVTFGDDTMYALHMTCHDRNSPFKCKICDQDCHEKYYFNVHLLRGLHQPKHVNNDKKHVFGENQRRRGKSTECSPSSSTMVEEEDSANEKKTEYGALNGTVAENE